MISLTLKDRAIFSSGNCGNWNSIPVEIYHPPFKSSGYRLDALVKVKGQILTGVEVDGPTHIITKVPIGETIPKRRQVSNLDGIPIVSVPYWEWDEGK